MAPLTTASKVKAIAKHLSSLSDPQVDVLIEDATMEVEDLPVQERYKERLTRYLAAHYGSLNIRQTQSESVGPLRRTFTAESVEKSKGLARTTYGQEYLRLLGLYLPKNNPIGRLI